MVSTEFKQALINKFVRFDTVGTLMTPFVVSKQKKTLYLHLAKTGGSTVTKILRDNGLDDGILTCKTLDPHAKVPIFLDIVDHWDEYFKFTFVRNKFSLLVSLWHYDGHPGGTFKEFLHNIVLPSVDLYGYWIDQYYLTTVNDKLIFDFVGHNETFVNDLTTIMKQVGTTKYSTETRANVGGYDKSKHFSEYYDDEDIAIVKQKFGNELSFFGWECAKI